MFDLTEKENSKILKYCKEIIESDKEYISESIIYISEVENSEFLGQCVASIFTILDDSNQTKFIFYALGISYDLSHIDTFENAESMILEDFTLKNDLIFNGLMLAKAIKKIKKSDQMKDIIKYGVYLIKKNNLDVTSDVFLKDMFLGFIKGTLSEN